MSRHYKYVKANWCEDPKNPTCAQHNRKGQMEGESVLQRQVRLRTEKLSNQQATVLPHQLCRIQRLHVNQERKEEEMSECFPQGNESQFTRVHCAGCSH